MKREEIDAIVQDILCDTLGVDEEEVRPDSRVVEDLGAESIDFLDLIFRLENEFDVRVDRKELYPEDILVNIEFADGGKLNSTGVTKLKERMPFMDFSSFEVDPKLDRFSESITVNAIGDYVAWRLGSSG